LQADRSRHEASDHFGQKHPRVNRERDPDRYVEELIALTGDYRIARAAFDAAARARPGRIVTLRQRTRLLADSRQKH
jgi:hypothetical protein